VKSRTAKSLNAESAAAYLQMSSRGEFIAAAVIFALMLALRLVNIFRYKFDSDESQHLHVIWGWANGFVQYRDVCDNHMPLFQLTLAPIYKLIGDRATILYWMRLFLLPFYFLAAWCTYRIGALCFSRRVGVWAVLMTGLYPGYLFCGLEFRTDNVWAPIWLLAILVLLNGPLSLGRATWAGLLIGLCFGISMKTSLLTVSIVVAGGLACLFGKRAQLKLTTASLLRFAAVFVVSALIIPTIIMAAFAAAGVWPQFRYWVFENNILPGMTNHPAWWIVIFPAIFPLIVYFARNLIRSTEDAQRGLRGGFLFLICGFYLTALWSFWSLVSRQDYLPYHPLAFVLWTAALIALTDRVVAKHTALRRGWNPTYAAAIIVAGEFLVSLVFHDSLGESLITGRTRLRPFWKDESQSETRLLRATLQLTEPSDFVLDEKGETVFRQRAFGPIWEPCVMERIERGLMIDNAAERCIATRTCVAVLGDDISQDASRFILQNYLYVGDRLWVVGAWLEPAGDDPKRSDFTVVIPAPYRITSEHGEATGLLDGVAYTGKRFLEPGRHSFVSRSVERRLALVWAQAAERQFCPF